MEFNRYDAHILII